MTDEVKVWKETVTIPTYEVGKPEKNPMFLEKRVYQGSSGVVYPHPVIEKIFDEKTDKAYQALFLENRYIKIMILPELGGRIQMAYDKVKERHFIYYNQVIKPALVGLTGPWISGGIEFNWPQHHRPSTFEPIDYTIEENKDGSKTVWVNEVERMFRTKGLAGFTLYPGKAYIEIRGKLYNRTPFPQTFLWWANPAVKVDDNYQSIFPPDVHAVFDHGKRDVSSFPIAKGVYYKVDYSPGTDISRYKNIPVPTSYMAVESKYNFIGGYEHDSRGGLLHVANHHLSPGKKQWTWGHGAFGQAWDRNLTDEDGPYIELMTGMFTDNQPDFSWLQPYEEKTFVQYFMPYREVGAVKNATKDIVANIEIKDAEAGIIIYTSSLFEQLEVTIKAGDTILFSEFFSSAPEEPYERQFSIPENIKASDVLLVINNRINGSELLRYQPGNEQQPSVPEPAKPAKPPVEVASCEQLYLTGLHLEQYRHATYVATDYYLEALKRDSGDVRNNNAMGLWLLRRGKCSEAEVYFRNAVKTITARNPNPYDGEPLYNLGWALKMQGKCDEAYTVFYKSVWNDAWQHAGFLNLARIAAGKKQWEEALELIDKSIVRNYHSHTARHLKTVLLRKLNRQEDAVAYMEESLRLDPFNFGCLYENYLMQKQQDNTDNGTAYHKLVLLMRNWEHNYIEYALDYAHAGLYAEAIGLLRIYTQHVSHPYTLVHYYLGWFAAQMQDGVSAAAFYDKAAQQSTDYCFPNRIEEVLVLQDAVRYNSKDANAWYLLGNFWYDKRQYTDAIAAWEKAAQLNPDYPTVHRNLSLACFNKLNDAERARKEMEKAFELDKSDARVLMELDQLYKKLNVPHADRLAFLNKYQSLVESRDDLYLEQIALYNHLGQYAQAMLLISNYRFHPWEGGEGKVVGQYLVCHIELAKQAIVNGECAKALQLLNLAETYPDNLGEGKLHGVQENDIFYLKGLAYEQLGDTRNAALFFTRATEGIHEPVQAIFYNDPQPDKIFYQGLAWIKLGDHEKAGRIFHKLIAFGKQHYNDVIHIDYFAVSLPDLLVFDADLNLRNKMHCLYLQGLGLLGLGEGHIALAEKYFNHVLEIDINHMGAVVHKQMLHYPAFG